MPLLNSPDLEDKESLREATPLFIKLFPLHDRNIYPYHGEGDKAGSQENRRFFWVLKGGEVDK